MITYVLTFQSPTKNGSRLSQLTIKSDGGLADSDIEHCRKHLIENEGCQSPVVLVNTQQL